MKRHQQRMLEHLVQHSHCPNGNGKPQCSSSIPARGWGVGHLVVQNAAVERIMFTIQNIVSSGAVVQYKHGITVDYRRRRGQYMGDKIDPYPHFILLEAGLSVEDALELEKAVHDEIVGADGRSALAKKKWEGAYTSYRPSLGGQGKDGEREYFLYLCWK